MLDLRSFSKTLHRYSHDFLDETLPDDLTTSGFASFKPAAYDPTELDWGVRAWEMRTLDEYRSLASFTSFTSDVVNLGLSFDTISSAVRILRDETRHVEICRRMVETLGGTSQITGQPNWVLSDPGSPLLRRIAATVIGGFCVGETVSVRMLAATRNHASDSLAHALLTCLTADESFHSRFGWTTIDLIAPMLSADDWKYFYEMLPHYIASLDAIAASAHEELKHAPVTNPFGCLPPQERLEVLYESIERDVLDRFEQHGIHARRCIGRKQRVA